MNDEQEPKGNPLARNLMIWAGIMVALLLVVSIFSGGGTASETAGNYSTRLAAGASTVTFSGGGLSTSAVASITMTALRNAEVDVQVNGGVNTLRGEIVLKD